MAMRTRLIVLSVAAVTVFGVLILNSGVLLIRGETVVIEHGDVSLSGKLALPRWEESPFPAAVIVHGSGRVRWSDLKGYARRLVPSGMAVLMYDKRGVGGSTGSYETIGVGDSERELARLAADAAAAVEWLRQRDDIDAGRIGLIGGSQAGWIMPLAASRTNGVAFIVAISGPAVSYGEEIYYSQLTGDDPGPYEDLSDDEIERRLAVFEGPFGFDPVPYLERLDVPSLWIVGGSDRSVPMERTLENLYRIQTSSSTPLEVDYHPYGDHSLRDVRNGERIDYWVRVRDWLGEHDFLR